MFMKLLMLLQSFYNFQKYIEKGKYLFFFIIYLFFMFLPGFIQAKNVVPNNDIEAGNNGIPDNWKTYCYYGRTDCQFIWDNTVSRSGTHSLKIKGGQSAWHTTFPVKPGKLYRTSFYFKAKSTVDYNPNASMNIYLWNKDKGTVLWMQGRNLKTYDGWILVNAGDYIAEPEIKELNLYLRLIASEGDESEVWFDDINVIEMDPPVTPRHGYLLSQGGDYTIWTESASQKIFKDDPLPGLETLRGKIQIWAAKGETEPFQVVIKPNINWENVSWEWTDFSGPSVISKENVTYYRVEYINCSLAKILK
jgi:hypothetical protein